MITEQCPHCGCLRDDTWLQFVAWADAKFIPVAWSDRDIIRHSFRVSRATAYRWIAKYRALRAIHPLERAA